MKKILIILQNAYGVHTGYVPGYDKKSFCDCHTGKRLKEYIPDGSVVKIINASPLIGETASSYFPPDVNYVEKEIIAYNPDVILACGKMAHMAIDMLNIKVFIIKAYHPAYRLLSKEMTAKVKEQILEIYGVL